MFGNALAGQREMATELVESLAVILVELIEEGAPVWVGQGFKDFVHRGRICNLIVAYYCQQRNPKAKRHYHGIRREPEPSRADHFFR